MLILENISCAYNDRPVFGGLNLQINRGASLLVVGGNGTGKTSFLKIVSGVADPRAGRVMWDNFPLMSAIKNQEVYVNFIGHELAVKGELTVKQNLEFWAALSGNSKLINYTLDLFGLKKYARTPVSELSKGWQKKVALSRLILCDGDVWVLDEPFSNLDADASQILAQIIIDKTKSGGITIASAHGEILVDFDEKLDISAFSQNYSNLPEEGL
jgi:heme exporter protein A